MRVVSLVAAVGLLVGAAVATALHFMTWSSWPVSSGSPRRYVDYLPFPSSGGPYSSKLTVHWTGSGGVHPSWWPLVPVGLAVGLIAGAILGTVVALAGVQLRGALRVTTRWGRLASADKAAV